MTTGVQFSLQEDRLQNNDDLMDIWDDDDDNPVIIQSPWKKGFDELRQSMVQVSDLDIYKRVMVEGKGETLGERRARITYHYNYFTEFAEEAFDSSYLRRKEVIVQTFDGALLPGVWTALSTMCKGEEAQFVIGCSMMFGAIGAPPRIPPHADILMVTKLIDIQETGDENAIDNMENDERTKFSVVEKNAEEVIKNADALLKQSNYSRACRNYHSVVSSLDFCQLADGDEENRRKTLLLTTYTRLMKCYVKMENWKKACSMFNELNNLSPDELKRNFDAHMQHGIALSKLGEFNRALGSLRIAQNIRPHDADINKLLIEVNQVKAKNESEEKNFWKKAFKQ